MIYYNIKVLLFFFLFTGMLSCETHKEAENAVRLTIIFSDSRPSSINVGTIHPFEFADSVLVEVKLDTVNRDTTELVLELFESTLAYLKIDENWHQLYLTPGNDLKISVGTDEDQQVVRFAGTGAEVNNYLALVSQIQQGPPLWNGKPTWQLNPEEHTTYLDSLREVYNEFHRAYIDTVPLPEELATSLKDRNRLMLVNQKENYDLVQYPSQVESGIPPEEIVQEESKYSYYEVPLDTSYLHNKLLAYEYTVALEMYRSLYISWPAYNSLENKKNPDSIGTIPLIADRLIRSKKYPAKIKEFLIAKNVLESLNAHGITPQVGTIHSSFKQEYPTSDYTKPIEAKYKKWLAIAPGQPAPEVTGTTPGGEQILLSDLQGKVVYVDVWATWCKPCIEEFPHSKKLTQEFEGNDEVVFLYVSVDRDENKEKWEKMVADKKLGGIHIIDQNELEENSIWNLYLLNGIPRYILIDQTGNIVDAEADRPSSGKIKGQIQELLSSKQKAKQSA